MFSFISNKENQAGLAHVQTGRREEASSYSFPCLQTSLSSCLEEVVYLDSLKLSLEDIERGS